MSCHSWLRDPLALHLCYLPTVIPSLQWWIAISDGWLGDSRFSLLTLKRMALGGFNTDQLMHIGLELKQYGIYNWLCRRDLTLILAWRGSSTFFIGLANKKRGYMQIPTWAHANTGDLTSQDLLTISQNGVI